MPFFSDDWIRELLAKINIADIVGQYVTLQNKSGRLWACCPFHNEKTPSFSVSPEKGYFHCFGCGKGGNAIHFVMEMEKMTFPEACTYLAEKVNLPVPAHTDNAQYEKRKAERAKIYEMNKIAARYFHKMLFSNAGKGALAYLRRRGLSDATIRTFGLGYAENGWDGLLNLLQKEGYTRQDMQMAGLVKAGDGKCYDLFRNRAMMPIINSFSEVIGFGGRVMDDSQPKYLNSPETAAFNKSKNLYNLNIVRKQKNIQYLILVEGYMDVIALYQYGIAGSVATLGTALTQDQARLLARYTNLVYVSYDGDSAGKKATLRAIDILKKENLECRIIGIPGGEDPDEYLKGKGREAYLKLLKTARGTIDYQFDAAAEPYDLANAFEKEKYTKDCIAILKETQSAIVKEKYVKDLARRTGYSESSIMQDLGMEGSKQKIVRQPVPQKPVKLTANRKAENYIAALLCVNPGAVEGLKGKIEAQDFQNAANARIFSYVLESVNKGFYPVGAELLSVLENEEEKNHAAALLAAGGHVFGEGKRADHFLADCIKRMQIRKKEEELQENLKKRKNEEDVCRKKEISAEIKRLTNELNRLKESLKAGV